MHRPYTCLLSMVIALALTSGAALAGDDQPHKDKDKNKDADPRAGNLQQQQRAPDGFVLVSERLVYVLASQPQVHMTSALAKLGQNDNRGAAEEIRIAADYIEMQGARGDASSDKISKGAEKLRKIAGKIESGEMRDNDKLGKSFAKANLALAEHHNALAKKYLKDERYVAAGHDLNAAAMSLRQAMVWHGEQPQQELVTVLGNVERVSAELRREAVGQRLAGDDAADDDRAQPAAAQQRPGDPMTGTTDAEARNIAEHAQNVTSELEQQIEQFASKVRESSDDQQQEQQRSSGDDDDKDRD